jgi:hypothetical protein
MAYFIHSHEYLTQLASLLKILEVNSIVIYLANSQALLEFWFYSFNVYCFFIDELMNLFDALLLHCSNDHFIIFL